MANGNEYGLSAAVKKETVVSSCINHKVTFEPEFYGKKYNLNHDLKTILNNKGMLQVLIAKKLTENLKLLLTGHLNLYNFKNIKTDNFGIKLTYEWKK